MQKLENFKQLWDQKQNKKMVLIPYTQAKLEEIIRSRMKEHLKESFRYFWSVFILIILVFSLLSHVIIRYYQNYTVLFLSLAGILIYIPFTFKLLREFKKLAINETTSNKNTGLSLRDYILRQLTYLNSFFRFKKWYEIFLTPLSCAIAVSIIFELYVPGGLSQNVRGAVITFFLAVASCIAAIYNENKRSFIIPIRRLRSILDEFNI